jgi:hypothetical protein
MGEPWTLRPDHPFAQGSDPQNGGRVGTEVATSRIETCACEGAAVTFIVNASRGEEAAVTVRLSGAGAIAKARSLLEAGWQVFITGPDGVRYHPPDFDKLLSLSSTFR